MGPHIGAVVGALMYQAFIGFHWPHPDSPDVPMGLDEAMEPLVGEVTEQTENIHEEFEKKSELLIHRVVTTV